VSKNAEHKLNDLLEKQDSRLLEANKIGWELPLLVSNSV